MSFVFLSVTIYFNIYCYVFTLLSLLIYLYIIDVKNVIQTSPNLSLLNDNWFLKINFFLFLASFIGIPPLLGFFAKIMLFFTLLSLQKFFFLFFFLLVNVFLLFFYLQQLRFLQSNSKKNFFLKKNFQYNYAAYFLIVFLQHINIFSCILLPFLFNNMYFYILF